MENQKYFVAGGTLVDSTGVRNCNLAIEGGRISAVGSDIERPRGYRVIDAGSMVVCPAFVDLHTHLRQPGDEGSETVVTGARAGLLGGYGALVAMPNTSPVIDSPEMVGYVQSLVKHAELDVYPSGAISKGRLGETLTNMSEMAAMGIRIFTDDGSGVQNPQLMRRALELAKGAGVTLAQHCEDAVLANGGVMHEGAVSSVLGLRGIPAAAEDVMVARDIELVRLTGARLHFLHISTRRAVQLVAEAKAEGLPISAEVTPHHLTFSDSRLLKFDSVFKVNPPLRSEGDRGSLWEGLKSGVFDAVATDHAPHGRESKDRTLDDAAFGMIGLQAAFGAVLSGLRARSGGEELDREDLVRLIGMFSWKPAEIAGIADAHGGPLVPGAPANVTVFDPRQNWTLGESEIVSKAKNSPYFDTELLGRVAHVFVKGKLKVHEGELCL